jgi:hypothetical protein
VKAWDMFAEAGAVEREASAALEAEFMGSARS